MQYFKVWEGDTDKGTVSALLPAFLRAMAITSRAVVFSSVWNVAANLLAVTNEMFTVIMPFSKLPEIGKRQPQKYR